MKVLLINNNPVVSRLTKLSARKEGVDIIEISDISHIDSSEFDLVFCDFDSCDDMSCINLKNRVTAKKKVLFCTPEDDEFNEFFDLRIHKPFLPSEVSSLICEIREAKDEETLEDTVFVETQELTYEPIKLVEELEIPKVEVAKIEEPKIELEIPKVEVVKIEEPKIELELPKVEVVKIEEPMIELDTFDEIKDDDIFELDVEAKKDVILELDSATDEINLMDDEPKILDTSKVMEIKELLDEEVVEDKKPCVEVQKEETTKEALAEEKTEKEEMLKTDAPLNSHIEISKPKTSPVVDALISMPIESLRELLKGATVNITIQFPKD
ncbi:MAG: hypothetical protein FNT15_04885 [Sulfurovum sp.]|nr:MAG: hypothetical protein FNT15_04885 [Sulfurovum sp.]